MRNLFISILFCIVSSGVFSDVSTSQPPNVLFIMVDDLRVELGSYGSKHAITPNMDALLARGMRFSSGYAAAPVCSPTRYSVQFGKSPARLKYTRVLGDNRADHNQVAIPQILKAVNSDYICAHLGKWHINAHPDRYSYDLHDGRTTNREGGFTMQNHHREWGGYAEVDPKRVDSITERAIDFISTSIEADRPFFIQLSHYAVHSDLVYSEATYDSVGEREPGTLHSNQAYAAMVEDLDRSIGTLLEAYDTMGLADNTYLIFTSDNGGMPCLPIQVNKGEPYPMGLNAPLLRGKWDLTEGGIRVPFSVMGPDIPVGSQSDEPVISYDLLPTIADLAGAKEMLPEDLDGRSFRSLLSDPQATITRPPEGLIFQFPHYNVVGLNEPHSAIRVGDYKLLKFTSSGRSLLFDVADDPGESRDLAKDKPQLASTLDSKLEQYLQNVDAERPEDSNSWKKGGSGKTKTLFFNRYKN